jgi:hypothetical protein
MHRNEKFCKNFELYLVCSGLSIPSILSYKSHLFGNGIVNQNKNIMRIEYKFCEILPNEIFMEKEPWVEALKKNPSLQTKTNFIKEKM